MQIVTKQKQRAMNRAKDKWDPAAQSRAVAVANSPHAEVVLNVRERPDGAWMCSVSITSCQVAVRFGRSDVPLQQVIADAVADAAAIPWVQQHQQRTTIIRWLTECARMLS